MTVNRATLACTAVVGVCAGIVLYMDFKYPEKAQEVLLLYRGLSAYFILLFLYFLSHSLSGVFTYLKSRGYNPEKAPAPEDSNIIYLNQEDEWFEVG